MSRRAIAFASCFLLGGCASTTVDISQALPANAKCQTPGERINALVLWGPRWRPDQKDVPLREAAAEKGIKAFFAGSSCFAQTHVRRVPLDAPIATAQLDQFIAEASPKPDRVLTIAVRELGPIVKLLASLALVEGGTDVLLDVSSYDGTHRFDFHVRWQHGGPWVLKGTGSLTDDIQSALAVALQPNTRASTPVAGST